MIPTQKLVHDSLKGCLRIQLIRNRSAFVGQWIGSLSLLTFSHWVDSMGETKEESVTKAESYDLTLKSRLFATIMLLIGLLSPVLISVYHYTMLPEVFVQGMFWSYRQGSDWFDNGFLIYPSDLILAYFPLFLLRILPVFQLYRYYSGKTTRTRVLIASIIGDGYFIFSGTIISLLALGYDTFHLPLIFLTIISILILWIFPIPDPTTPWKSEENSESWWDKSSASPQDTQ